MKFCKECEREFNPETSDTYNPDFCNKWCDKAFADRNYEKEGRGVEVFMGTTLAARKRAGDIRAQYAGRGTLSEMANDRVMMKHIMEGNPSDKSLKADATLIEQTRMERPRREWDERKRKSLQEKKERYRAKYGVNP